VASSQVCRKIGLEEVGKWNCSRRIKNEKGHYIMEEKVRFLVEMGRILIHWALDHFAQKWLMCGG